MKQLIKKLVETASPSGYESPIRQVIREEVTPLADAVHVDNLGNLVVRKGQTDSQRLTIMLAAHMDEIGVIATHVDENGYVRFLPLGGVHPRTCIGGRVRYMNGVEGVIGIEDQGEAPKMPSFDQLFIDVGAVSAKGCPVRVGDMAVFERPFLDLGDRLVAKAMDDRIGVAILVETLRLLSNQNIQIPHQLYFVFSTQEEVGTRGATTAAYALNPDIGLAVDVTISNDTPKSARMALGLGKGPAIKVRDQFMLADPRIVRWMADSAERAGIPYQMEVLERGGTDARAIQLTRAGVASGCLSIPCRYVHAPSEMVDFGDVQKAVKLLAVMLSNPVNLGDL
jgi:endoglucanase